MRIAGGSRDSPKHDAPYGSAFFLPFLTCATNCVGLFKRTYAWSATDNARPTGNRKCEDVGYSADRSRPPTQNRARGAAHACRRDYGTWWSIQNSTWWVCIPIATLVCTRAPHFAVSPPQQPSYCESVDVQRCASDASREGGGGWYEWHGPRIGRGTATLGVPERRFFDRQLLHEGNSSVFAFLHNIGQQCYGSFPRELPGSILRACAQNERCNFFSQAELLALTSDEEHSFKEQYKNIGKHCAYILYSRDN